MLNILAALRHGKFRDLERFGPDLHCRPRHFRVAVPRSVKSSPPTFSTMPNTRPESIEASSLREWVLSQQSASKSESSTSTSSTIPKTFKVVDVRDDDYQGGNIPGSMNVPSRQVNSRVASLVDDLKDNEAVVFTCALSQQRGPIAFFSVLSVANLGGAKVFE
jgi:Rhodanese-like domain